MKKYALNIKAISIQYSNYITHIRIKMNECGICVDDKLSGDTFREKWGFLVRHLSGASQTCPV